MDGHSANGHRARPAPSEPTVTPERPSAWRFVLLNALLRVAAAGSGQIFAFVLADRLGKGSGGSWAVALTAGGYFGTELVLAPRGGRMADRRGARRVLRLGLIAAAVSALLGSGAALVAGGVAMLTALLVLARVAEGLGAAFVVPATLTLVSEATDGDPIRQTRVMGAFEIASVVGMIVGFAGAGALWDSLGVAALIALIPVYAAAWGLAGGPPDATSSPGVPPPVRSTLRALARRRSNVAFAVAWLAVNAVVGAWFQYAPYLLKLSERSDEQALVGGRSGNEIGLVFAVWGVSFLIGIAGWSWWGARWPRRRVLGISLVGMLGVAASLTLVNHGAPDAVLLVAVACVMVEAGFTPAAFVHLAELSAQDLSARATTMGLYSVLLGAGQLIGAALTAPFVAAWAMDGLLAVTTILALVALLGVFAMGRESRSTD